MTIVELRKELGLTLDGFAERLGLSSKGYVSDLERGASCSVKVALEIERLSGGRISASSLHPDVELVRRATPGPETAAA